MGKRDAATLGVIILIADVFALTLFEFVSRPAGWAAWAAGAGAVGLAMRARYRRAH